MADTRTPRNLLVTGGCGFIGSAFIRHLFRQPDFTGRVVNLDVLSYAANPDHLTGAVDEQRYELIRGDVCDRALVESVCREHQVDTVVHFAAETHVDRSISGPGPFVRTNVVGTHQLLEVVRALPHIHLHHVSTDEVYGALGPTGYFTEDSPYRPSSPYSATKAAADHLVRAYARTYGVSTTLSISGNNYGPGQFPEKLLPLALLRLLEERPLPIYGDGQQVRDWLYVEDHVEAIWLIVRRGRAGETYHVAGRCERTNLALIHELIDAVASLTGRDPEPLRQLIVFVPDRPGHDRRYALDSTKLERELGWRARHQLPSGLRATVAWYLEHRPWLEQITRGAYRQWIEQQYGQP